MVAARQWVGLPSGATWRKATHLAPYLPVPHGTCIGGPEETRGGAVSAPIHSGAGSNTGSTRLLRMATPRSVRKFPGAPPPSAWITAARGWWQFPVGGGIVAQSNPSREYEETWDKAEGLLRAILG